jgi:hypothetical protein
MKPSRVMPTTPPLVIAPLLTVLSLSVALSSAIAGVPAVVMSSIGQVATIGAFAESWNVCPALTAANELGEGPAQVKS